MIWELLATIFAGLGAAGLVMALRALFKKLPKWLIPAGAGLGVLFFQVYNEYSWFAHTQSQLPQGTTVITTVEEKPFYKPWAQIYPQTTKFIALDQNSVQTPPQQPQWRLAQLYFFQRHMSAHHLPVIVDCVHKSHALLTEPMSERTDVQHLHWTQSELTHRLIVSLCP